MDFIETNLDPISIYIADFLFLQAYAESKMGKTLAAVENGESAFSIYRVFGNHSGAGWSGNFVGISNLQLGNYFESLKWFNRAMDYYSRTNLLRKQSMVHLNIGVTHYKVGDYRAAFAALAKSLELGVSGAWVHRQCFANIALGNVQRLTRDFTAARKHLHTAYSQAQALGFPREEALSLEFLGDVYRDEGKPAEARRFYDRAMMIAQRIAPKGDIVMELHRRIGECLNHENDPAGAVPPLTKALKMARAQGDRFEEGVILRVLAEVRLSLGDLDGAAETIADSCSVLGEIGARHEHAVSLLRSAETGLLQLDRGPGGDTKPCLDAQAASLDRIWDTTTLALDLLLKVDVPWWTEKVRNLVDRVSRRRAALERDRQTSSIAAGEEGRGAYRPGDVIIHTSGVMRDLIQICDMFAGSGEPVLISGETGTGKELIARRVHQRSPRQRRPLVTVNVSAIPATMFEREFFGHVKGAFSGADNDGEGFAARASGGTLFLDEIGELPLEMQPKLLRLIQEGTYQAIGDPRERHADIRLVAATNADLAGMVKAGRFRSDLFYRLKILELSLPPVRDRREDILPLLQHFLSIAAGRPADLAEFFNQDSLNLLMDYPWPGNVREIGMIARRATMELKAKGRVEIELQPAGHSPACVAGPETGGWAMPGLSGAAGFAHRMKTDRARILLALEECGGNRIEAARKLGLGRSTLYRKMEKLGIPTRKR